MTERRELLAGLLVDPDPHLLVGLMGILKAGGAVVPLDPRQPLERSRRMVEDCGLSLLVTEKAHYERARELAASVDELQHVICLDAGSPDLPGVEPGSAFRRWTSEDLGGAAPGDAEGRGSEGRDAGRLAYVLYTSGSTGIPKGVPVSHRNLLPLLAWSLPTFDLDEATRVLQTLSPTFDFGLFEVLTSLLSGATLYQLDPEERADVERYLSALERYRIDTVHATPSFLREVAGVGRRVESLATVHLGGEALTGAVVSAMRSLAGDGARVYNGYGPTETSVNATLEAIADDAGPAEAVVPIGRATAANRVYVVDAFLRPVPFGVPGELCIGGPGVARGYLGRPARTAAAFLPDPFVDVPGARLYRSGDLTRLRRDGRLDFLGRMDRQLKVRGFRIEPGEIEAALVGHPAVGDAVVAVRNGRLVAWWVASGEAPAVEELRAHLRERLPPHQIPAALVPVEGLLRTAHGKLDVARLPEPAQWSTEGASSAPPRTPTEEVVAAICAEKLGLTAIGVDDDLLELGCHSLLATKIVSKLRSALGIELPLVELFRAPTVAGLAAAAERARGGAPPPLRPLPRPAGDFPLSFNQERVWFHHLLDPDSVAYNVPRALRMRGPLDHAALEQSFTALVERHEILRTTFHDVGGRPVQRPGDPYPVRIPIVDLSALPAAGNTARVRELTIAEGQHVFDLGRGPLLRLTLVRCAADDHVLILIEHHLVHDGWTQGVLVRDFLAGYRAFRRGRAPELPALPIQYADFAAWQRRWLESGVIAEQLAWWSAELQGSPQVLELPTDFPRPPVQTTRGEEAQLILDRDLSDALRGLARQRGVTLFMLLLAGFQVLMRRWSGQEDLVLGTAAANRRMEETEGMLGMVINTLALRTDLSGSPSFGTLLERTRQTCLGVYAHQDLPFERLVEALRPDRVLSHHPIFQVMFSSLDTPMPPLVIPGMELELLPSHNRSSKWDLDVMAIPHRDQYVGETEENQPLPEEHEITLVCEYSTDLFEHATIERLLRSYRQLLASAAQDPDAAVRSLAWLDEASRRQLVETWSGAASARPGFATSLDDLARHAAERPQAGAVVSSRGSLTYAELAAEVEVWSRCLAALAGGREERFGLRTGRSSRLVVGMLAAMGAGGAYVPLDPRLPADRVAAILADAGVRWVLTDGEEAESLAGFDVELVRLDAPPLEARREPPPRAGHRLAYVLYTSGTTGEPKGVGVSQQAVSWYGAAAVERYGSTSDDRIAQFSNVSFDISVEEIFGALSAGAALVIHPEPATAAVSEFWRFCDEHEITSLCLPTAYWHQLAADLATGRPAPASLRWTTFGGERVLPERLSDWWRAIGEGVALFNSYGPTETTVCATIYRFPATPEDRRQAETSIGTPVLGARVYILDEALEPLPVGVPGALYIGGGGVARGYLGRPSETARKFLPDPFSKTPGERIYRSGDRARFRGAGDVEFLGRDDAQVKVRGFRVEPEEVASVLASHPAIRQAVVVPYEVAGDRRLAAYLECAGPARSAAELASFAGERLPDYMVPSRFHLLTVLPLNVHGKVDRLALPDPREGESAVGDGGRDVAGTRLEELVANLWAEVLDLPEVGLEESFFALGGHSLIGTRLIARVRALLNVELPLRELFRHPTVRGMACAIETRRRGAESAVSPALERRSGEDAQGDAPLSFAQQRLWFLDRLEPESAGYHLASAFRLRGTLDETALEATFTEIVRRHEILRTSYPGVDGLPVQRVAPPREVRLPRVDLSSLPARHRRSAVDHLLVEAARRPFDLSRDLVLRVRLLRLGPSDHLLSVTLHHVAGDGWSTGLLAREVQALYTAFTACERSPLRELPLQYADYAVWQRRWLEGAALERDVEYWRRQLAGRDGVLELPLDRRRPAVERHRGAYVRFRLDPRRAGEVRALAKRHGASSFMVLLAALHGQLARYTRDDRIPVGAPVAGRRERELENLIGFFVNTVVLVGDVSGDPDFGTLLGRVREAVLDADAHQDLPFEKLVEELDPRRSLSHSPFFQVMLAYLNLAPEPLILPGLEVEEILQDTGTSKFDWTFFLTEAADGGLDGALNYDSDLFDETTARRSIGHLLSLLDGVIGDAALRLSQLPLLSLAERSQLAGWNETPRAERSSTLHGLFSAQVLGTPEAPAVASSGRLWTYRQLETRAGSIAARLRSVGVGPEVRVGVCLGRSPELLAALLGVLKAGGVYVPLDPAYPPERVAWMLEDASTSAVIVDEVGRRALPADLDAVPCLEVGELVAPGMEPAADTAVSPSSLAYLIYTSGSTGRPKAVAIEHASASALVHWARRSFSDDELSGVLASTSVCFDLSVWEIFVPLSWGGTVVVADDLLAAGDLLRGDLPRGRAAGDEGALPPVRTFNTVPSVMSELLNSVGLPAGVRTVNLAGEPLPAALASELYSLGVERVLNLYGPSEDTTYSTWSRVPPDGSTPTLGLPVDGTAAHLVDRFERRTPVGVMGELLLGGAGLARGYLGRPTLTAERFVPDPFATDPGQRLYRTGDLARRLATGELEYQGRRDQQVKLRGFRIEPGEVEARLLEHPAIREAAVAVRPIGGDPRLVGYVVFEGSEPGAGELRAYLAKRLPEHLVPALFVSLEALPQTPNGKIDRRALPAPEMPSSEDGREVSGTLEEVLAAIWCDVLGVDAVPSDADFFTLGGHSLLAVQVVARIRRIFQVELPLAELFHARSISALAGKIETLQGRGASPALPPLEPMPREGDLPLSFAQQRLWFLDQLQPGHAFYNVAGGFRVSGELDPALLAAAFTDLVRRHETLRTRFPAVDGRPSQVIDPPPDHFPVPVVDLAALSGESAESVARSLVSAEGRHPFDLARGPLLRVTLLRVAAESWMTVIVVHHIVSDQWSIGVLTREIARSYQERRQGVAAPRPALPIQYADYALWQRRHLDGEVLARQVEFWRQRLTPEPAVLDLPTDRPRPPVQSYRGGSLEARLPAGTAERLAEAGRHRGATSFMTYLAVFFGWLGRLTGQTDLAVGTPVAGRDQVELEELVGFFLNTLVLRADVGGVPSLAELIEQVRDVSLDAFGHRDVPFEMLAEELRPQRALSHSPLFQVLFVLQNRRGRRLPVSGLELESLPIESGSAKFDLTLLLDEREGGLVSTFEYASDLFDRTTVERLAGQWGRLVTAALADPEVPLSRHPLIPATEREQLLVEWNDTAIGPAAISRCSSLHSLFSARAAEHPHRVAIQDQRETLSYGELEIRANRLARYLRDAGNGPDSRVGLLVGRSPRMAVAVLAILKAGAAYVPLDPSYPSERLAFMLAHSGAPVLLVERPLRHRLATVPAVKVVELDRVDLAGWPASPPPDATEPDHLAYVMYTSGSTGRPKGIGLPHRSLVNLIDWHLRVLPGAPRMLQFASLSFDVSFHELFAAWLSGGTVSVIPEEQRPDMLALARFFQNEKIDRTILPVVVLHQLAEVWNGGEPEPQALLDVVTTGEQLVITGAVRRLFERLAHWRLHNHYGPAETHVVTALSLSDDSGKWPSHPSIGRPIADTSVSVLDSHGAPAPLGTLGELYLGGVSLARGYLGRPGLSAAKFVPDPFGAEPGARLYRTGDLARFLSDGRLVFVGRRDHQLKIRGFRVEPEEVETILCEHPGVREAFVMPVGQGTSEARLVAYTVLDSAAPSWSDLRSHLRVKLPEYMVPSSFVAMDALPLTVNQKIDRKALPVPVAERPEVELVAPRNDLERDVAAIWREVLGLTDVGVLDDFFESGGHSLLATQLISRLRRAFDHEIPLRRVFETPTIAGLAAALDEVLSDQQDEKLPAPPPLVAGLRATESVLSHAQERLWFLDQLEPGNPFYNVPWSLHLEGRLDLASLDRAVFALISRHEVLRTTYAEREAGPVQRIRPQAPVPLPEVDLSALSLASRHHESHRLATENARHRFDLENDWPVHLCLLRLGIENYVLAVTVHHIAVDGWSTWVMTRELAALYSAFVEDRPSPLPAMQVQYADFAAWQRGWLRGEARRRLLDYWRRQLAGAPTLLSLPTDRPRPAEQSFRGACLDIEFDEELTSGLRRLCRRQGVTSFMALLAVFEMLVHQRTGRSDFLIGSDVANRNRLEIEGLVGFFVNELVLRADLDGNSTFRELVDRTRETTLGAYAHQDLPFATLVEELHPQRNLAYMPLVQMAFTVQNVPAEPFDLPDLKLTFLRTEERVARFDLAIHLAERDERIQGVAEYSTDLFDAKTIVALIEDYRLLLGKVLSEPELRVRELVDLLADSETKRQQEAATRLLRSGSSLIRRARRREVKSGETVEVP